MGPALVLDITVLNMGPALVLEITVLNMGPALVLICSSTALLEVIDNRLMVEHGHLVKSLCPKAIW